MQGEGCPEFGPGDRIQPRTGGAPEKDSRFREGRSDGFGSSRRSAEGGKPSGGRFEARTGSAPVSPSTTAIRMSWTYEEDQKTIRGIVFPTIGLRSSFITESQNLAPSLSAIQRPRTSRSPSRVTPRAM